jgi:hypothetical protein
VIDVSEEFFASRAAASRLTIQEILNILYNAKFRCRVNKILLVVHNLSQTNPIYTTPIYIYIYIYIRCAIILSCTGEGGVSVTYKDMESDWNLDLKPRQIANTYNHGFCDSFHQQRTGRSRENSSGTN